MRCSNGTIWIVLISSRKAMKYKRQKKRRDGTDWALRTRSSCHSCFSSWDQEFQRRVSIILKDKNPIKRTKSHLEKNIKVRVRRKMMSIILTKLSQKPTQRSNGRLSRSTVLNYKRKPYLVWNWFLRPTTSLFLWLNLNL